MSRAWGVRGRSASARQSRRTASNDVPPTYRESQAAMPASPAAPAAKPAAKSPPVQPLE
jgi:hypothetical protein